MTDTRLEMKFVRHPVLDLASCPPFSIIAVPADYIGAPGKYIKKLTVEHFVITLGRYQAGPDSIREYLSSEQQAHYDGLLGFSLGDKSGPEIVAHSFGDAKAVVKTKIFAKIQLALVHDKLDRHIGTKSASLVEYEQLSASSKKEIFGRVATVLDKAIYHVLLCNCEHFATWAKFGVGWSEQGKAFSDNVLPPTTLGFVGGFTISAVSAVTLAFYGFTAPVTVPLAVGAGVLGLGFSYVFSHLPMDGRNSQPFA